MMIMHFTRFLLSLPAIILAFITMGSKTFSQEQVDLTSMSAFKKTGPNWQIAGDLKADPTQKHHFTVSPGKGVLVNQPTKDARENLFTQLEHGDLDIELDYMMAAGSNAGIYLQGRYEVQMLDSWGILRPNSGDNGGIYERWDDARPEGKKGYEGYAPRQNVSKAPGLWQHVTISFQAPRFAAGKKISNARFIRVELNGVLIHENVELTGPTRSSMADDEVALGPIMIQGDHGPVALRHIKITQFNKQKPVLDGITASIYKGKFVTLPSLATIKPVSQKTTNIITANLDGIPANDFLVRYAGTIHIKEPGEYHFNLNTSGGPGLLKINNKEVLPTASKSRKGNVVLQTGDWPFELVYAKHEDWNKPSLALESSGPGVRNFSMTDEAMPAGNDTDPILVNASENTILRSFVDLPGGKRVVHAVNVGSEEGLHYTYDMDNGMLVQIWRGEFLDATPMWHSRGDGSSRPTGSVLHFGQPRIQVYRGINTSDSTGASFLPKGYLLDDKNRPIFIYFVYGKKLTDAIRVLENMQGLSREINIANDGEQMMYKIAEGSSFEEIDNSTYLVGDKSYYLKLDEISGGKPFIRDLNGTKELVVPVKSKLRYSIIF